MTENQSYLVNEIYPCLQGEGPHAGTPSILLRMQICNLRCTWCDTPYTHTMKSDPVNPADPSGKQNFKRMSLTELIDQVRAHHRVKHVILSGGEPTLQNLAPIALALNATHRIEVESNGTQIPHKLHNSFEHEHYTLMEWNISPKGKNADQIIALEALQHWANLSKTDCKVNFKFVIRKTNVADDVAEVESLISAAQIPTEKVIAMAEGTHLNSQISNVWLENLCLEKGWRMSARLHVLTHGNLRGV